MENRTELTMLQLTISGLSSLIDAQIEGFKANPCHNEYMKLAFNIGVLEDTIKELKEYMKFESK